MNVRGTVQRMGKIGRITLVCFVVLALFLQGKPVAFASTTGTWTAETSKSDIPINSVAYGVDGNGHGLWVTGESNGKIDTSPDGVTWTFSTTQIDPSFNDYFSSAVFGSEWVLVGQIGEIVTSPDGSTWTKQTSNTSQDLLGVTYGGHTYVAVGVAGTILTSTDGIHWSSQTAGSDEFWGVAYGDGQFVAVSDSGSIYTSSDGIAWTPGTSGTSSRLDAVAFGGGLFVAAGDNGTIRTSPDGATWTSRASGTSNNLYGIAYGAGKYVAVGDSHTIVSSLDGITWGSETPDSEPSSAYFSCATYGGSKFVAGGGDGGEVNYPGIIQAENYSNSADLSGLELSSGALSPAFASGTTSYTASVDNSVTSVNVTPTVADSTVTLTINGSAATSGSAVPVSLSAGSNTITVVVTAQDGTTFKTYTVTVTRAAPSTNGNLSDLTLSHGTLSPTFASGITTYTADVDEAVTYVDVTPTVEDPTATVTVHGAATTSGSAITVPLNVGSNAIAVKVTAQDGTSKTYTISITRQGVTQGPIPTPPLTPTNPPVIRPGKPGEPFKTTLTVTGGTGPYTWSILSGALPSGLHVDPATGVISGTTNQSKPAIVTFQAVDASGKIVTERVVVDVVPQGQREMVWGTSILQAANVPAIVAKDAGVETTYMPIWYVMQMLKSYGVNSVWDGHKWSLTTNTSSLLTTTPGRGTLGIYVNGKFVQMATGIVAVDPNSKNKTTYMPIWYVQQLMNALNIQNTWDGTTWTVSQQNSAGN